ncbi:MAG: hypothetical protein ABEL51_14715 [Salinibacter sp.]
MHLSIVDTAGIQPYIFGSNRLRENIGASYLVAQATGTWALESVPGQNNVEDPSNGTLDPDKQIERGHLDAEVLYSGGGNVVVLFREEEEAEAFKRTLSEKVLERAPGLRLVATGLEFQWSGDKTLSARMRDLRRKLFRVKRDDPPSAPLLGLGVTAMCGSTGLPAIGMTPRIEGDPDSEYPASAEILEKHDAYEDANARLQETIELPGAFEYPRAFDDLGRTEGEMSYLAVVHADGNDMGKRISRIGERYDESAEGVGRDEMNRGYIRAIREYSRAVEEAAETAQRKTLESLCASIDEDAGAIIHQNDQGDELNRIELDRARQNGHPPGEASWHLPFRPLVFGGDDLTFVSDGRLGLALALDYVKRFEEETERAFKKRDRREEWGGPITACAGAAIVKTHYPFSRAYRLSTELTDSAKKFRREIRDQVDEDWDEACLDWHFSLDELDGSLNRIRDRRYSVPAGSLTLRPVALDTNPKPGDEARTWNVVRQGISVFQSEGWAGRRNKVKRLREALRQGESRVEQYTDAHGQLPALDFPSKDPNLPESGWMNERCAYFDAVELSDLHMPLK